VLFGERVHALLAPDVTWADVTERVPEAAATRARAVEPSLENVFIHHVQADVPADA
jgi:hypothetical protein